MRLRLLVATVILSMAFVNAPVSPAHATVVDDTRADAEWILRAQLPDGAIAHHVDKVAVWPYLANFAAQGLATATRVTGDRRYSDAAWRWLEWYQAHQDPSGFITDYRIENGVAVSTGDMDSTDAYAGTFLTAVEATWLVTRDDARVRNLRDGIAGAVNAIQATQDTDGLTWAKPSWPVKYLMDQAEAYAGLRSAANLGRRVLRLRSLATRADLLAVRIQSGVATLWNPGTSSYDWARHESGSQVATRWSLLYPDALSQVWPGAFGLVSGDRANVLLTQFGGAQPNWDRPTSQAEYPWGVEPVGYAPIAGWAYARAGDLARARVAETNIRTAAVASGRAWPFTPGNAGQLIRLRSLAYGLAL